MADAGRTGLPSTVTPSSVSEGRRSRQLLAVEGNAAFGDHPLDVPPRCDAGAGEQLGDPLRPVLALAWAAGANCCSAAGGAAQVSGSFVAGAVT